MAYKLTIFRKFNSQDFVLLNRKTIGNSKAAGNTAQLKQNNFYSTSLKYSLPLFHTFQRQLDTIS
jgi:hypothetical protein